MQILLYNFFIFCYGLGIKVAALFNPKAKLLIEGRQQVFQALSAFKKNEASQCTWVHCASLGEFEQGRPLIEALKQDDENHQIVLSFFSPSGYEVRKDYAYADLVVYLPADTKKNAAAFINAICPDLAIFVKYEFWHHFLTTLQQNQIPTLLVSARFRKGQAFFKWYGSFYKSILKNFDHLFVQNKASVDLLQSININNVTLAGDTRVDRVMKIAQNKKSFLLVETFCNTQNILVAGSTWAPDEALLAQLLTVAGADFKMVIAPHEIDENHLLKIEALFPNQSVRYSKADKTNVLDAKVLIIDNIGMLSSLYQYGRIAYIGGGFGKGIHNTLEAVAFGTPVIFGPQHEKFDEALELIERKAGFCVRNDDELKNVFNMLQNTSFYQNANKSGLNYMEEMSGATEMIMEFLRNS